jgi:protein-S-isoprenylcysteine O-methyltransferase Ste14
MDKTRYVLGVLLIVGVPPAIIFWLLIHPFVGFWRRIGPWATYIITGTVFVVEIFLLYRFRVEILGTDLGTDWMIFSIGFVFYAASAWISVLTKRQLKLRTFVGLQELSEADPGDRLLQEGIYGVVRHPRYLSVIIGTAGFAMFVNYVGAYLMVLASVPALFLVTIIEERELAHRFGAEYEEYRSRVPAIFPRLPKRS